MKANLNFILISCLLFNCVGTDTVDDLIPEKLEITNPIMSLEVGASYDFMYRYLNNVGIPESKSVRWETSDASTLSIDENGRLMALEMGQAEIALILEENNEVMDKITVEAADETVVVPSGSDGDTKSGTIESTSSYKLEGNFQIANVSGGVEISVAGNYVATEALPGLYVYLSNNPSTVDGALEIGAVTVFSGAHTYTVTENSLNVDTYAYLLYFCKPFNVKVGHGEILD